MPEQLPADNCRQTTTTAEKSNYLKEKPDYPTDNSKIYASAVFKTNNGASNQNLLTVPVEAFVNGVTSGQLFIVDNNGTAKLIKVTIGKVYGNRVHIISGLKEGEQVITSGQINLDNGSKINIVK
jgi:multidrug efflux pump subunit AcrA (membrane-fusion protein)